MITFGEKSTGKFIVPIDLGLSANSSFNATLRRPTYAELLADAESGEGFIAERLKACVIDWAGVVDEKKNQIPFTFERFQVFCEVYPQALAVLANRVGMLYHGITETERKNLYELPGEASGAAPQPAVTASISPPSIIGQD